ncbi:MAG: EF-hand domain-containing protein [Mariprofundaceae bacterium]|nr:EF-hand domain-containing protein [Mariprofundaceae bacterium]
MIKKLILPLLIAALAMPVAAMACPGKGDAKRGGHFQKMDTNGDGVVTADEHAAMAARHFSKMDANGDGKLTSDEMKAGWKEKRKGWKNKACPLKGDCPKSKDCPMKEDCPYNKDRPKDGKK